MGVVTVELDVFSGEPNPSWVLNPGQAHEAESRLRDLPAGQGGRPEGKLGYRGFLVAFQDCHGRTEAVQIGAGLVERAGEVFEDVRGAEAWLMRMAEDRGFGALLPEPR